MMWKKSKMLPVIVCSALLYYALPVFADEVPARLSFQGRLTDVNGDPVTDTKSIVFKIYAEDGTTELWTETQGSVSVSNGIFNVNLGDAAPIPTNLFPGATRYLEINVAGDGAMAPKIMLVSNGYAFCADTLDGKEYAHFVTTATTAPEVSATSFTVVNGKLYLNNTDQYIYGVGSDLTFMDESANWMRFSILSPAEFHWYNDGTTMAETTMLLDGSGNLTIDGDMTVSGGDTYVSTISVPAAGIDAVRISTNVETVGNVRVGRYTAGSGVGSVKITEDGEVEGYWEDNAFPRYQLDRDMGGGGNAGIGFGAGAGAVDLKLYRADNNSLIIEGATESNIRRSNNTSKMTLMSCTGTDAGGALELYGNDYGGGNSGRSRILIGKNGEGFDIMVGTDWTSVVAVSTTGVMRISSLTGNGAVYSNGTILTNTDPSSVDYKENIKPVDLHAERILNLEPKSFTWKENNKPDIGYIAEEIKETVPELYREDGNTKGWASAKLPIYIIELIKQQNERIKALESEIAVIKTEIKSIK